MYSRNRSHGSFRIADIRMIAASTAPTEIRMLNTSCTTSRTCRRDSRYTPASIAMCASNRAANADHDTPAGRSASLGLPQHGQRNRSSSYSNTNGRTGDNSHC